MWHNVQSRSSVEGEGIVAEQFAIGIDTGATKILGGVVNCATGEVVSSVKMPSPTSGPDSLVPAIEETIAKILAEVPTDRVKNIERIGIGLAGQVDKAKGLLRAAPNLGGGIT